MCIRDRRLALLFLRSMFETHAPPEPRALSTSTWLGVLLPIRRWLTDQQMLQAQMKRRRPRASTVKWRLGAFKRKKSGSDLLSRAVSRGVPSALEGLTSVFGMGTGGTPPTLPPENWCTSQVHTKGREINSGCEVRKCRFPGPALSRGGSGSGPRTWPRLVGHLPFRAAPERLR